MLRLAVFASGGGTNLQALLDGMPQGTPAQVCLVVSDRADARALDRARSAGVEAVHVPMRDRPVDEVSADLLELLHRHRCDFVALAGFLRLVPPAVVSAFRDRIVNIHPALLPAFGGPGMYGRHVHDAVLAAGCRVTGATVHVVDERYDEGRILTQWPVPVFPGDTTDTLAARVLRVEHQLYPATIAALANAAESTRTTTVDARGDMFRLSARTAALQEEMATLMMLQDG